MADDLQPIRQEVNIDINENGAEITEKQISKLNTSLDNTIAAGREVDKTFDEVYEGLKPLTARMGEAEDRLYELALAGQTTSKEYQELLKTVANYRKTQIETDRVVDSAATTLGQKLAGGAQLAATSIQAGTAGMALFGDQSEDTEKALLKVQAALSFADAIGNLSTLGGQFKVYRDVVVDTYRKIVISKQAEIAATNQATASQTRFNLSVLANPYVLAAAAIAALAIGTYAWIKATDEAAKREEELKTAIDKTSRSTKSLEESTESLNKTSSDANEIEVLRARAFGATEKEIQALIKSQKELSIQRANDQKAEAFENYRRAESEYYRALRGDNEENTERAKENLEEAFNFYKKAQEQRRSALLDSVKTELQDQINSNNQAKEQQDKAIEEQKKADEKKRQLSKEAAEKLKKDREDDQAALLEFQKKIVDSDIEQAVLAREQEEKDRADSVARLQAFVDKNNEIEKAAADEAVRIEKAKADQEAAIEEGRVKLTDRIVGFLQTIAGKNKTLQKAAIIAESAVGIGRSVVQTQTSNVAATAQGAALAIPTGGASVAAASGLVATNYASLGLGIAANVAATAKALSALGGGGSSAQGGAATASAGGQAATPSRNVAQVAFQGSPENQISTAISQQQRDQPPIQAFVVSQEVTDQQELDRKKTLNNSF